MVNHDLVSINVEEDWTGRNLYSTGDSKNTYFMIAASLFSKGRGIFLGDDIPGWSTTEAKSMF